MFHLEKKLNNGIRVGRLDTPHGSIQTPFFMPVGTVGSVKAVSPEELEALGAEIILCNTYHLYLRPGEELIKKLGGLHRFMNWNRPILTDSGGYQVFSLGREKNYQLPISNQFPIKNTKNVIPDLIGNLGLDPRIPTSLSELRGAGKSEDDSRSLVKITDDGVEFRSHLDGSSHFFTPENVIDIQLDLGVDILMPLDVCPSGKASPAEIKRSVELTIQWARRSKEHFEHKLSKINDRLSINNQLNDNCKFKIDNSKAVRPLLHGIVQGGLDPKLRKYCADELIKMDFDGYSVGGLAVDFETRDMWKIVELMGQILPEDKQRYLMGVGTPDDIIHAVKLGMDMFDCVLPTRLARHGSVYCRCHSKLDLESRNNFELINLLNSKYREDGGVIDKNCGCPACRAQEQFDSNCEIPNAEGHRGQNGKGFSRAYISHLIRSNEILGIRLTTLHNLWQYLKLMESLRLDT